MAVIKMVLGTVLSIVASTLRGKLSHVDWTLSSSHSAVVLAKNGVRNNGKAELMLTDGLKCQALALVCSIGLFAGWTSSVHADASADVDSTNWWFEKYQKFDTGNTTYWIAANAASATYSQEARGTNEVGTTGLKTSGPTNKF